jgi:glycosyltransferase involved in cell wall biosynthesis
VALIQMTLLLSKIKPQIIHSYTPKAGLLSMISAWILNVPVRIHTFTGLIFPSQIGFKKQLLILIDKIICLCSTKIIPEGRGVKNDLISYGITSKKLDLIGFGNISGIDTNYFSETELDFNDSLKKLGIKYEFIQNKFIYCFIGRLNVDKGLRELYEAFVTLPQNTISLDLYNKMKSNDRIFLLGFVEDVRLILKLSKILVLPSYREGFPNVLLQSLSMKVPAIATNINGCNEIIIDNHNGWLIEPNNFRELADKMKFTLQIENVYFEKIKENTRESITSRYEQSEFRKLLLKEYYSLYKS